MRIWGRNMAEENRNVQTIQDKRQLRREVLARRDALSETQQSAAGKRITESVLTHAWFREAGVILGFASFGSEISTDGILQETLRQGKKLYLPRIAGDEMVFGRVWDLAYLQTGYKGIREPAASAEQFAGGTEAVLMLMPGVAFDAGRGRIGYGKGFYDRFLAAHPQLIGRTIGIAHACQLVEQVPCEDTDIRPAQVIVG